MWEYAPKASGYLLRLTRTAIPARKAPMSLTRRGFATLAGLAALSACSTSNPLSSSSSAAAGSSTCGPMVLVSPQYYSNEIFAQPYAQFHPTPGVPAPRPHPALQRGVTPPEPIPPTNPTGATPRTASRWVGPRHAGRCPS